MSETELQTPPGATDDAAIRALLHTLRLPLQHLFQRFQIRPEEAEDLVQEALFVLVKQPSPVHNAPGYVYGTVRRLIGLRFRRRAASRLVQLSDEHLGVVDSEVGADGGARRLERCRDARRLVARLPPLVRRVVILYFGGDRSHRQIAVDLGRSEVAVRQILSRGLARLRRDLAVSARARGTVDGCGAGASSTAGERTDRETRRG
jgi:RNA polymerase sigma-70 factor (ECF subfamily)